MTSWLQAEGVIQVMTNERNTAKAGIATDRSENR